MSKMVLYRYTATAKKKPENLYKYVRDNGSKEAIWVYNDLREALEALPDFETVCKKNNDGYKITFYALEKETV